MKLFSQSSRAVLLAIASMLGLLLQLTIVYVWANEATVELYATFLSITASINLVGALNKPALNTLAERYGAWGDYSRLKKILILKVTFAIWLLPLFSMVLLFTNEFDIRFLFLSILAFIASSAKGVLLSYCIGLQKIIFYIFVFLTPQITLLTIVFLYTDYLTITQLPSAIIIINLLPFILFAKILWRTETKELSLEDNVFENSVSKSFSMNIVLKADKLIIRYLLGDVAVVSYQICISCMQVFAAIQNFIVKALTHQIVAYEKIQKKIITSFMKISFSYYLCTFLILWIANQYWGNVFQIFFQEYKSISITAFLFSAVSIISLPAGLYFNFSRLRGDLKTVNLYTYLNIGAKLFGLVTCSTFGLNGIALSFLLSTALTSILVYFSNANDKRCIL